VQIPGGMTPDEQLTFVIGSAARAHEVLEVQVASCWEEMVGRGTVAQHAMPRAFVPRLDGIKAMLPHAGHSDVVLRASLEAVAFAAEVHRLRSELVHNAWDTEQYQESLTVGETVTWQRRTDFLRGIPRPRAIEDFEESALKMSIAMGRMGGVTLLGAAGTHRHLREGDDNFSTAFALVRGYFDVITRSSTQTWSEDDPRRSDA